MFPNLVDKVQSEISKLRKDQCITSPMKDRIQTLGIELGFLKLFIWFLPQKSLKRSYIRATVRKGKLGIYGADNRALDHAVSKLLQRIEFCKKKIRKDCLYLLDFPSKCKFSNSHELLRFINCTLSNLRILVRSKAGAIFSERMQVRALIKKLRAFEDFVKSTENAMYFGFDIRDWAFRIACVSVIYWVDQREEAMAARMKAILTDLLHMVQSYSSEVTGLCSIASKASKLSNIIQVACFIRPMKRSNFLSFNTSKIGEAVATFVDFLLPIGFMKILRKDLIFLVSFLMHPYPTEWEMNSKDWNLVVIKVKSLAGEIPSLICSLTVTEMNQETRERNVLINHFQGKTEKMKTKVRKLLYPLNLESWMPHSPVREPYFKIQSHFPATNALGFTDFLLKSLGNLKETSISQASFLPFARDQLVTLYGELLSVRPHLKNIQDLESECVELKDLQIQITDAIYQAEHAINSCQIYDIPIWYNVLRLSDVIEEIKFIKRQTDKIMNNPKYTNRPLNANVNSVSIHLGQTNTSRLDERVVGFEDEAEKIVNRLTRGSRELVIVSIIGMAGQGKTTLAKKVYNSPSIQRHFHKYAWCFVSQVYEDKLLLLDILRDITSDLDDKVHNMSKEELGEKLCKCLRGRRYLIIMDDIWDIKAWDIVKQSFPNDMNGSRILFTGRNRVVSNPHFLRPLNDKESMELLKQKMLPIDNWPSDFTNDVKKVLKVCKGLPLAIVVVAGLLNKESNDSELCRQIVRALNPTVASERCMEIIELSYKNLPDFLKPCFLYLGAVGRCKVFKVHKLIQLWIAEGFVGKSETKRQEETGREYLEDLIGRSLVIVHKKSFSSGEIKECRIHDLLLKFCSRKAEEERFIHFSRASNLAWDYDHYRMCMFDGWIFPSSMKPEGSKVRSLLICLGNLRIRCSDVSTYCFFIGLKFLRVLDLGSLHFDATFPKEILRLICLRYLSIRTSMTVLPSSIRNLCNLETFHVVTLLGERVQVPYTIWNIKTLRNVDFFRGAIMMLDDNDANVHPELGNLDRISTLYLSNVEDAEKLLRGFPRVRKLKLEFSESWDCEGNCEEFEVLHSLSKLESLNLMYPRYVTHTCALRLPTTLKSLVLSKFGRPWSEISTIGKLPNLEVLKFLDSSIVGETWHVEDEEFFSLKYLKLSRLGISDWKASSSSFPCLERLVVRNCPVLLELPSIFEDVLTLEMIQIHGCLESLGNSAESIRDEQRDMGNEEPEVLISDVLRDHPIRIEPNVWRSMGSNLSSSFHSFRAIPSFGPYFMAAQHFNVARETLEGEGERLLVGVKKINAPKSLEGIKRRNVPSIPGVRRTNLLLKHNCQPRKAIMSRHTKEELKRDK